MAFAERYGCSQINEINMEIVLAGFERATRKDGFRQAVGAFLQYSYNRKMIKSNLRHLMPSIVRHHCVPSVYSPEEVEQLLASIDRQTAIGKRNYAIILIAARLGLRTSDIVNLKFDNIKKERIEIIQFKTKQPLTTVLTDEIKDAISDYINNGRPQISDPHIFLHKGGYGAISTGAARRITQRAFAKSGIVYGNRKTGLHSLRASLATALLSEGNDYPTIQKVLGQEHIQSTKFYAKADIEQLRTHAIAVPPPTGNFASLLRGVGV
jgi:site-specific recombinase XerD